MSGFKVRCKRVPIVKRTDAFVLRESDIAQMDATAIVSVRDLTPEELEKHTPKYPPKPPVDAAAPDDVKAQLDVQWQSGKERFEAEQAALAPLKYVTAYVPIYDVLDAFIDDRQVRIFHTIRGPIMGVILEHTEWKTVLYSPCFLDPNVAADTVNCIPIAFAGHRYTVYHRNCLGESLPDEALLMGYPTFILRNRAGDYKYRAKGAYAHIEAGMAADAKYPVTESPMRTALRGLVATSDIGQKRQIAERAALEDAVKSAEESAEDPSVE